MKRQAIRTPKQNWFQTLNASLESEGLVDFWPMGSNISYGETVKHTIELTEKVGRKKARYLLISVTRNSDGCYERPVFYNC